MDLLRGVVDPELGADIVELGMARGVQVHDNGHVQVEIALTTAGCPLRAQIQKDVRARIVSLPGVTRVTIDWGELDADETVEERTVMLTGHGDRWADFAIAGA